MKTQLIIMLTTIISIILAGIYYVKMEKINYSIEKVWAWVKCVMANVIYFLLLIPTFILYPILFYPTRKAIRFFWYKCGKLSKIISFLGFIFLNDPDKDGKCDDYGTPEYRRSIGYTQPVDELNWRQKWWISYLWSIRNWAWNTHRFMKPKYSYYDYPCTVDIIENTGTYYNGTKKADPMKWCVLKWKFEDGTEADNFGTVIDLKASVLGKIFVYYRVNRVLYFRYSYTWIKTKAKRIIKIESNIRLKFWTNDFWTKKLKFPKLKIWSEWKTYHKAREVQIGMNATRFKIRNKIRKF